MASIADSWIFTAEELDSESPSRKDGITYKEEQRKIAEHIEKMLECAALLRISGPPTYVAAVLFRRYYLVESLKDSDTEAVAAASIFLSCKVCEYLRQSKDIIYSSRKAFTKGSEDYPDGEEITEDNIKFFEEKRRLLSAERDVLRVLNFNLTVELPQDEIRKILTLLFGGGMTGRHIHQAAMNFLSDSLSSEIHLLYGSREIGAACVLVAATYAHVNLTEKRPYDSQPSRLQMILDTFNLDGTRLVDAAEVVGVEIQQRRLGKIYGVQFD